MRSLPALTRAARFASQVVTAGCALTPAAPLPGVPVGPMKEDPSEALEVQEPPGVSSSEAAKNGEIEKPLHGSRVVCRWRARLSGSRLKVHNLLAAAMADEVFRAKLSPRHYGPKNGAHHQARRGNCPGEYRSSIQRHEALAVHQGTRGTGEPDPAETARSSSRRDRMRGPLRE